MNLKSVPSLRRVVRLLVLSPVLYVVSSLSAAIDTPALTWTERPDWINVKTDVSPAAVGNGVNDDTSAIQAALNLAKAAGAPQRAVYLPSGTYKITSTLTWGNCDGRYLVGCGRTTTIAWYGASGGTMFLSTGAPRTRYVGIVWDGRNLAGIGFYHQSTSMQESPVRHEHEKFLNCTIAGIKSYGGGSGGYLATAEVMILNCLFSNCAKGFWNGSDQWNSYSWLFDGCEFVDCGSSIYSERGKCAVYNTHFQHSTVQDVYCWGNVPVWLGRCTSHSSNKFYVSTQGSAPTPVVIQDCHIGSWATNPAFNFGTNGTAIVYDCDFLNPPNTTPPILLNPPGAPNKTKLIHSNNTAPGSSALYSTSGLTQVYSVPDGSVDTLLSRTATDHFIKDTVPGEGPLIDVKASPYNAVGNGVADDTTPIQNAINAARNANNGSVVYLPVGNYKITSSLSVFGGNYRIQGCGMNSSTLHWAGSSSGTAVDVNDPQNISLENFEVRTVSTACAVRQRGTTSSSIVYDGVFNNDPNGGYNLTGRGLELVDLPTGSKVYLKFLYAALTVDDCGRADIYGKFIVQGRWIVKGADYPKTGFLGVTHGQGGQMTDAAGFWDVLVQDNQDLAVGEWYSEDVYRHMRLERGSGTSTGRVSIQGLRQHSVTSPEFLQIDNYQGRVMYAPGVPDENLRDNITHTGTNAVDLILMGLSFCYYQDILPNITTGSGARRITLSVLNYNQSTYPETFTYMADQQPSGWDTSVAAAFDHLRDLGNADLRHVYGYSSGGGGSGSLTNYFTSLYTGTRTNHTGPVGYQFTPAQDITVTALGRPVSGSMNQSHTLRIWQVTGQTQVASVTVTPSSSTDALGYKYAMLTTPVLLTSGTAYRIVSEEVSGQSDTWRDVGLIANHSSLATIQGGWVGYGSGVFPGGYNSGGADYGYSAPAFYTGGGGAGTNYLSSLYTGTRTNHTGPVGYQFTPTQNLTVKSLGRPVGGTMNQSHTIRIWQVSNQTQVASITVTPSSPSDSLGYKYEVLPQTVPLTSGVAYRIVTEEISGQSDTWRDVGPIPNHSGLATIQGGWVGYGSGVFPGGYTSGGNDNGYAAPTFFTP